jgi:hypothetical protein
MSISSQTRHVPQRLAVGKTPSVLHQTLGVCRTFGPTPTATVNTKSVPGCILGTHESYTGQYAKSVATWKRPQGFGQTPWGCGTFGPTSSRHRKHPKVYQDAYWVHTSRILDSMLEYHKTGKAPHVISAGRGVPNRDFFSTL